MSQIAEETGIGRATLYKYFSDVESILVAWHERQVTDHLQHLVEVGEQGGDTAPNLPHSCIGVSTSPARQQLSNFIRDLLTEGANTGHFRDDVAPAELASYCLHALGAASSVPSKAAVRRFVRVSGWAALPRLIQLIPTPLTPEGLFMSQRLKRP